MLKKVHQYHPSDTLCMVKSNYIECSVCNSKAKSIIYVCASGHVISRSCQSYDTAVDSHEGGDYIPEKERSPDIIKKELQSNKSDTKTQDLASGDHDKALISDERTSCESKKDNEVEDKCLSEKNNSANDNPELTIEYKNKNYKESSSTVISNLNSKDADSKEELQNFHVVPRPVVCPVTDCSKMVTIDSIMLHFHFDHSKVPRIILEETEPQQVLIKPTSLSTEIQCIATFFIKNQISPSKENNLLLLMAVQLQTSPKNLSNVKYVSSRVFTRSIHTQTEKLQDNNFVASTECLSRISSDFKSCVTKTEYDDDDVLLLWLCKLEDEEKVYNITLLGINPKRGYCYMGDAIHVREKQDPSSLYSKSKCLIVKRSAVSSLCNLENQLTVIVSTVQS